MYIVHLVSRARIYPFSTFPGKLKIVQERQISGEVFLWKSDLPGSDHIWGTIRPTEKYNLSNSIYKKQGSISLKDYKCKLNG